MTLRATAMTTRREAAMRAEREVLAVSNAQLEITRAEASAKAEQLEATLRGMTDGVSMVDAQLRLVEWNAGFAKIAGLPLEALRIGLPMEEILRMQARHGEFGDVDIETEVRRRLERLSTTREGVTQRRTPDGRMIELRRNFLPDGGFITVYSDITAQKAAADALLAAKQGAEEANAAKSRFVAVVSHEIRTPLNAVLNALAMLDDASTPSAGAGVIDMAKAGGNALASLINDILEMSRAESGNLTLRPGRFALRDALENTLEVFQPQATARGLDLRLELAEDVPTPLVADAARIRQIMLNLLSNAVKFANRGEVTLLAWMERRAGPRLGLLGLAVRDRGPAITEADRQRLFRPFSRLEGAETAGIGGTGLGLSICQSLAEAMGGAIGCDGWSAPDGVEGNSFWLVIPVEIPDESIPEANTTRTRPDWYYVAPDPVTADQLRHGTPRTRILLVEDVAANRVVTATMLRRAGHMVDCAENGEEAVTAAAASPYDLILMDVFMPGIGGREACRRIRAFPGPTAQVPILALTADTEPEALARYRADGMTGALGKPVSVEALREAIDATVWAPPRSAAAVTPEPETNALAEVEALDPDRVQELRANLAAATYAELIEECLTDLDLRLPALRGALSAGTLPAIIAQAHSMVGMAASYGMRALELPLRDVVRAAQAADMAALGPTAIPPIEAALARSAQALRATITREVV